MTDSRPSEAKVLLELKVKGTTADRNTAASQPSGDRVNTTGAAGTTDIRTGDGGAAEAAGVLTAVDEDDDGAEDAELPKEFDYHSDGNDEAD